MKKVVNFSLLILLIVLSIFTVSLAGLASADGGFIPPYDKWIVPGQQRAVVFHENGIETLVLSTNFRGNAKDFAWIIPTPSKPEVTKGSDEIFTKLQEITRVRSYSPSLLEGARVLSTGKDSGVTVVETKKVDYYDVNVLSATDSKALVKWLNEHKYTYPNESAYIFNDYIANGWYFIAVKITTDAQDAEEVVKGLKEGHPTPLKIVFSSGAIIYPLRISSIKFDPVVFKLSQNLPITTEVIEHFKELGYNDLADKKKGPQLFNDIVNDIVDGKKYEDSVAKKYSRIIPESDYVSIKESCSYRYSSTSCFQNQLEAKIQNYLRNQDIDISVYIYWQEDYIPIQLYVIAEHKKQATGFYAGYANWITKKQIEKLAYDINGKPLLQPQSKKLFLTFMTRSMRTADMTSDIFISDAEDNKKVGTGPGSFEIAIYGILMFLLFLSIWLFSPFGIAFIVCCVIAFVARSRTARLVSIIIECIITFLALALAIFLIVVLSLQKTIFSFYGIAILLTAMVILTISIILIALQIKKYKQLKY